MKDLRDGLETQLLISMSPARLMSRTGRTGLYGRSLSRRCWSRTDLHSNAWLRRWWEHSCRRCFRSCLEADLGCCRFIVDWRNRRDYRATVAEQSQARGAGSLRGYGGKDCKLNLAYKNQCVVVVWPSVPGASAFSQSAASIEEASDMTLPACAAESGAQRKIAYSACTEPVLVGN